MTRSDVISVRSPLTADVKQEREGARLEASDHDESSLWESRRRYRGLHHFKTHQKQHDVPFEKLQANNFLNTSCS